jgi:polyphosphate glucokinase
VKDKKHMSYKDWATKRLQRYYEVVEMLFSPDLFVVGGGVSKDHAKFFKYLNLETPIVPATLFNRAGIIGAAWQANWRIEHPDSVNRDTARETAEKAIRAAGGED